METLQVMSPYQLSLGIVSLIDHNLDVQRVHYRQANGEILLTLDTVLRALREGNLMALEDAQGYVSDSLSDGILPAHMLKNR